MRKTLKRLVKKLKGSSKDKDKNKFKNKYKNQEPDYSDDGMSLWRKNLSFIDEPRFAAAYAEAIKRAALSGATPKLHYRIATECWAAAHGAKLEGDFVECGVNTGIYAMAICHYVDINRLGKRYFLFDTFSGIPVEQVGPSESSKSGKYDDIYENDRAAFAPFPKVHLVRGKVPDTLNDVAIDRVAYLSIDMNIAYPERKALEHFWPKLSTGAVTVFDDYAFKSHSEQKKSLDEFAASVGSTILSLPTGQGLLIKG